MSLVHLLLVLHLEPVLRVVAPLRRLRVRLRRLLGRRLFSGRVGLCVRRRGRPNRITISDILTPFPEFRSRVQNEERENSNVLIMATSISFDGWRKTASNENVSRNFKKFEREI